MQLLRAATLTVNDLAKTVDSYVGWLDYRTVESGKVAPDLAASWGCPASANRPYVILQPASGSEVFIRCVEGEPVPDFHPRRSLGWAALELCVTDVLKVQERMLKSPFQIVGPAKKNPALPTVFPMQVRGPDDELVYLTEILGDQVQYDLPRAQSTIDRIFIIVLGCSDMLESRRWFADNIGMSQGRDIQTAYATLAEAFGTPANQIFTICTMTSERDVLLELDQYPAQAETRPANAGALPPGISMSTFHRVDFDAVPGPWITPPVRREGPIYAGARTGTLCAPDGTLVEVVEAL